MRKFAVIVAMLMAIGTCVAQVRPRGKGVSVDPVLKAKLQKNYDTFAAPTAKRDARGLATAMRKFILPSFAYIWDGTSAAGADKLEGLLTKSWSRMMTSKSGKYVVDKLTRFEDRTIVIVIRSMTGTAKDLKGKVVPMVWKTYYQDEWLPTPSGYGFFVTRELRSEFLVNGKNILPKSTKKRQKVTIRPIPNFRPPKPIKFGG